MYNVSPNPFAGRTSWCWTFSLKSSTMKPLSRRRRMRLQDFWVSCRRSPTLSMPLGYPSPLFSSIPLHQPGKGEKEFLYSEFPQIQSSYWVNNDFFPKEHFILEKAGKCRNAPKKPSQKPRRCASLPSVERWTTPLPMGQVCGVVSELVAVPLTFLHTSSCR